MIRRIVEMLRRRPAPPAEDPMPPALRARLDAAIRDGTPAIALSYAPGRVVPDTPVSSLGGRPSLMPDAPWPTCAAGHPMIFLAQLNFADLPPLDGFPASGLLSFFVADADDYGCAFPSRGQEGFATLFTPDPTQTVRRTLPDFHEGYSPFGRALTAQGAPLIARSATCPVLPADWRIVHPETADVSDAAQDAYNDALIDAKPGALYYGGNPDFTQDDFRSARKDSDLDTVLLQIGYTGNVPQGWHVSWGDAGEACFLIARDDLAERRFDRAAYNWDCY